MEYKDIVALYFERSNQMQTLWTFYLGVCLVLPLLVGVMRSSSRKLAVAAVLSFAFAVIAAVSLSAAMDNTAARLACRDMIYNGALEHAPGPSVQAHIQKMITPPSVSSVMGVQIGGDILTLATLWYIALAGRSFS